MPDGDRLRELQRRAYGPGGGLSPAEAQELADLQDAARPAASPSPSPSPVAPSPVAERARNGRDLASAGATDVPVHQKSDEPAPGTSGEAEAAADSDDSSSGVAGPGTEERRDGGRRLSGRTRLVLGIAAVAAALLIGLGAGRLLFGPDPGPAMDAKQQEAWTQLEASGKYDAGSIRMLGEQYGITAWYATQKGATTECLVLTPSEQVSVGCLPVDREDEAPGYYAPLQTQVEFGDDKGTTVNGVIVTDVQGDPVAVLQKWDNSQGFDWTAQYDGDELVMAKNIVAKTGVDGMSLQIAGYDGDTPIWLSQESETCLYVADLGGVSKQSCDADSSKVILEMPNATYGLRDTNQGTRLTTLAGHDPTTGDPGTQASE